MDAAGPLALVVLGIIVGWVIELVVDFLILRPHWIAQGRQMAASPGEDVRAALQAQTAALTRLEALRAEENAAVARLNAYLAELSEAPDTPVAVQGAVERLGATLTAQQEVLQHLETLTTQQVASAEALPQQVQTSVAALGDELRTTIAKELAAPQQDRLTDIKGIGPAFAGRLHEMGIHTFKQLAALTPEELSTMMNVAGRPKIDATSWIEQARLYVSGRAKAEEAS